MKIIKSTFTRCIMLFCFIAAMAGCKGIRQDLFTRQTPYESYKTQLKEAGLDQKLVGAKWINAGINVLDNPVQTTLPFSEIKVFNVDDYLAVAYHLSLKEGQNLHVAVEPEGKDSMLVFIDLFRKNNGNLDQEASAGEDSLGLTYRIRRDGDYIIRIQPELLARGLYSIQFWTGISLNFPVPDKNYGHISSFYGDPRDGGRRKHEGVDIFASRGTPVLAVAPGTVRRTGTNRLGGKVVWLHDKDRGYNYYYAHLDSQLVKPGVSVNVGDTIGLIGNTGNAVTTPPHLHFGIYSYGRGSVNPFSFFHRTQQQKIDSVLSEQYIGSWASSNTDKANVRVAPGINYPVVEIIGRNDLFRVTGVSEEWFRIQLQSKAEGFIHQSLVDPIDESISQYTTGGNKVIREFPFDAALAKGILLPGTVVEIYSELDSWLLVKTGSLLGWIHKEV